MLERTQNRLYAGFTIGPIHELMQSAKKTRELWFASYFFSWYMENLTKGLKQTCPSLVWLSPVGIKDERIMAGRYHDRFIAYTCRMDGEALYNAIIETNKKTADYFVNLIYNVANEYDSRVDKSKIDLIFKQYMQTRFIVLTEEKIENNNPVSTIDKYLNTLEEHRTFPIGTMTNTCVRCNALESVASAIVKYENTSAQQLCPFCLIKVFCDKSDIIRKKTGREIIDPTKPIFPSIPEITAADLGEEFINILREKSESDNFTFDDMQAGKKIEPYHKYYAIVQADGDNVGKFASEIIKNGNDSGKPPSEYETILSERMSVFAEKAYLLTKKDFNGHAVYIGGDDLLALMPVAYQSDESTLKTVVDYAVALNNLYKENVCDPIKNKLTVIKDTTLSIGISISYYKYPLSLALDNAGRLLFDKAKSDTKNGCAINLIKHSGASKEIVLRFSKLSELEFFSGLLKNALKKDSPLIHAIHHKLGIFLPLLSKLETQDQIANFLTYRFDMPEDIEQDKIKDKNIELYYVKKMLEDAVSSVDKNIAISNVINKLALIKFLRGDAE